MASPILPRSKEKLPLPDPAGTVASVPVPKDQDLQAGGPSSAHAHIASETDVENDNGADMEDHDDDDDDEVALPAAVWRDISTMPMESHGAAIVPGTALANRPLRASRPDLLPPARAVRQLSLVSVQPPSSDREAVSGQDALDVYGLPGSPTNRRRVSELSLGRSRSPPSPASNISLSLGIIDALAFVPPESQLSTDPTPSREHTEDEITFQRLETDQLAQTSPAWTRNAAHDLEHTEHMALASGDASRPRGIAQPDFRSESVSIQQLSSMHIRQNELVPKIVGQYVLGDVIGEGSYGKVREGFCSLTLRRVAVKIMKQKRLRRIPGGEKNVQREIELLQKLRHTNVIELFDVLYNAEKAKFYMVFEFCPMVLDDMLIRCPGRKLRPPQARRYFHQLLDGLEYLACQGVVHRDIKPSNLLITRGDVLKIIDFGVAVTIAPFEPVDRCASSAGTPAFQPPEIAAGEETSFLGSKMDIWAAGITLFIMLAGEYPFVGENMYKLFENIARCDVPSLPDIEEDAEELIRCILQRNPEDRPTIPQLRRMKWMILPAVPYPASILRPLGGESSYERSRTTILPYLRHAYAQAPADPDAGSGTASNRPSIDTSDSVAMADAARQLRDHALPAQGLRRFVDNIYSRIRRLGGGAEDDPFASAF